MTTNNSGNRSIEARLLMDSTGKWKIVANSTPTTSVPKERKQILKVTGPDGKIKFFYGNKPQDGGINPMIKAPGNLVPKGGSRENKLLLSESQVKSLAMLLSSVKSQMKTSSATGASLQTVAPSGSAQRVKGLDASNVPEGVSNGSNDPNKILVVVIPGNEKTLAKNLKSPTGPVMLVESSSIQSGKYSNPGKKHVTYIIKGANETHSNKKRDTDVPSVPPQPNNPNQSTSDMKCTVLSRLLHAPNGEQAVEANSNVKGDKISIILPNQTVTPGTRTTIDPVLSRVVTSSKAYPLLKPKPIPNFLIQHQPTVKELMAATTPTNTCPVTAPNPCQSLNIAAKMASSKSSSSAISLLPSVSHAKPGRGALKGSAAVTLKSNPVDTSKLDCVGTWKPQIKVPQPSTSQACTPDIQSMPVMVGPVGSRNQAKFYVPVLTSPRCSATSWIPLDQYCALSGSTPMNALTTFPRQLQVPLANSIAGAGPISNPSGSGVSNVINVGRTCDNSATKSSTKFINDGNKLSGKIEPNVHDDPSKDKVDCSGNADSTLRIEAVFSLKHTENKPEDEQHLENQNPIEVAKSESVDNAKEAEETYTVRKTKASMKRKRTIRTPLITEETDDDACSIPLKEKPFLKQLMFDPCFVVIERMKHPSLTARKKISKRTSKASKFLNPQACSRSCREEFLQKLCSDEIIPCSRQLHHVSGEIHGARARSDRLDGEHSFLSRTIKEKTTTSCKKWKSKPISLDMFMKEIVQQERRRHAIKYTNMETPSNLRDKYTITNTPCPVNPYTAPGKLVQLDRKQIVYANIGGMLETVEVKPVQDIEMDILSYVPAPAAFEDIVSTEERPPSPQPLTLEHCTNEIAKWNHPVSQTQVIISQPTASSTETALADSVGCGADDISELSIKKSSNKGSEMVDHGKLHNDDDVLAEADRQSPSILLLSHVKEEPDVVKHSEYEEASDSETKLVADCSPIACIKEELNTEVSVSFPQSSPPAMCSDEDEGAMDMKFEPPPAMCSDEDEGSMDMKFEPPPATCSDEDEGAMDMKIEPPPAMCSDEDEGAMDMKIEPVSPQAESDDDDDWGTMELKVDTDSENEDMDIICCGLPPAVPYIAPEVDPVVNTSLPMDPAPNTVVNERIQRLKAMLEEQTKKVNSLRRVRRRTK